MRELTSIRRATSHDRAALYEVCLRTGKLGEDATSLYRDPSLIGQIYAGPYLAHARDHCFVAEDDAGVGGYVVGTHDTQVFEEVLESKWWPPLRETTDKPDAVRKDQWNADEARAWRIHQPCVIPAAVSLAYPAHLHLNLLPRMHRQGLGTALFETWRKVAKHKGASHAHIGAARDNSREVAFWAACGFEDLTEQLNLAKDRVIWMGRGL